MLRLKEEKKRDVPVAEPIVAGEPASFFKPPSMLTRGKKLSLMKRMPAESKPFTLRTDLRGKSAQFSSRKNSNIS